MMGRVHQVLISDPVSPICAQILRENNIGVTCADKWSQEKLLQEIKNYDGLIVRSETKVTAQVLEAATRLRIVGRAGTGVDNVDIASATRRGVLVMNTPGGNTLSAAEHTCAMIAALSRHIPQACAALKNGIWDRKTYVGSELNGKTLAVLGLGRIGREVAFRMKAFGMRIIGFDPMVSKEEASDFGVEKMELDDIWPIADYLTIHTPYMPQTHHLINASTLKRCKRTVRVVNIARGGIVDEEALLDALQKGHCQGAALDVFTDEPPKPGSVSAQIIQHPLVVCTPHLGASTVEAQERVAREIAEQFVDLLEGRQAVGIVNAPMIGRSMLESNKPWMQLAQALGYLACRLADGISFNNNLEDNTNTLELLSYGDGLEDSTLLAAGALVGYLNNDGREVNIINANLLAKDSGIVATGRHIPTTVDRPELDKMIKLVVKTGSSYLDLIGSVQGGNPILFAINGSWFPLGATLSGNVLLFSGKRPDSTLMALIASLAGKASISAVMCTRERANQSTWLALRTAESLNNPAQFNGPEATFIAQLAF